MILTPLGGDSDLDHKIALAQNRVSQATNSSAELDRLGWLLVLKARTSFDAGYYKLAEQCSLCLEGKAPGSLEALLLRGHVLHNLHRFKDAEPLARTLVEKRGAPFDFGLLGDVLMEQGRLADSIDAYQKMVDLRPDLHAYARGAHVRWLRGDLVGAERMMTLAASAATPQDADSAAWAYTRLAGYQFQNKEFAEAEQSCATALDFQKDYPPALLLRGRMLLAKGQFSEAVTPLTRAADLNPLPDYQWTLLEALRAARKTDEAVQVEKKLNERGAISDPRSYSLYLATRKQSCDTALELAEQELGTRADVFTQDALAWALAASGNLAESLRRMELALREGTRDARLFFHAASIAASAGDDQQFRKWSREALNLRHLLLPSERAQLDQLQAAAADCAKADSSSPSEIASQR
jgi:tetratricopeptide (TPR) repeat protein